MESSTLFAIFLCSSWLLAVAVLATIYAWYRERAHRAEVETRAARSLEALRAAEAANFELIHRIEALAPYQTIVDVEGYARQLREHAENGLRQAEIRARDTIATADETAARIRAVAESERERIVSVAENEARRVAGEALDASRRAKELQLTVKAFENTIRGYGDEYLLPAFGLLDELAEQYGFDEVGKRLKAASSRVTTMVKQGQAATCDYVEANRRATAIAFVLDAFIGKVDSVLASVRHDNYGILQKRITDAFVLVNHHGEAFRNARVLPGFRDAQLEVLKWAVAAHQLRQRDREEQRALREQMREEERARREYERAMKEAARDEEVARKALDKAQKDLSQASEAQRAKYEAKLLELSERLREAEERGRRALSMAQQTKSGNVYVISNIGSFGENVLKIGMTRRLEPLDRVRELGDASVPFEFDVHAMIPSEDAPALERQLHKRFLDQQVNKVNARKEFFRVSVEEVRAVVEAMSLDASWTMSAACREWRESQAIEARIRTDRDAAQQWRAQQVREHDRAMVEQALVGDEDGEAA